MIGTKAEILNEMKMSCHKVYFTMNIKLSWNFMHHVTLYQYTKVKSAINYNKWTEVQY